jgi:hypothetical protein
MKLWEKQRFNCEKKLKGLEPMRLSEAKCERNRLVFYLSFILIYLGHTKSSGSDTLIPYSKL